MLGGWNKLVFWPCDFKRTFPSRNLQTSDLPLQVQGTTLIPTATGYTYTLLCVWDMGRFTHDLACIVRNLIQLIKGT